MFKILSQLKQFLSDPELGFEADFQLIRWVLNMTCNNKFNLLRYLVF